ncbi:hypothetical protein LINPERPRIM_LOCUS4057 [Linum perenne]
MTTIHNLRNKIPIILTSTPWLLSCKHMNHSTSQAPYIHSRRQSPFNNNLRRHVRQRPSKILTPRYNVPCLLSLHRQPKIGELQTAALIGKHEDVVRLNVAVSVSARVD